MRRCRYRLTPRSPPDIVRLFWTPVSILAFLVSCADPEHGRRDTVAVWVPRRGRDTTTVSAAPPRVPDSTPTPAPQDTLPTGYALTDTTNWGTIEEDGQRAVLRRGGVAIDTVDPPLAWRQWVTIRWYSSRCTPTLCHCRQPQSHRTRATRQSMYSGLRSRGGNFGIFFPSSTHSSPVRQLRGRA